MRRSSLVVICDCRALGILGYRLDGRLEFNADPLLFEGLFELRRYLLVLERNDAGYPLEQRDFGAECVKCRSKFHAHSSASNNHERLWNTSHREDFAVCEDRVAVDLNAGERARL